MTLEPRQVAIRAILHALDNEHPAPPWDDIYKRHPENMLNNDGGEPVMSVSRIVDVVLNALGGTE